MLAAWTPSHLIAADDDPGAALLDETKAFRIDPLSPYGKGLTAIYHSAWGAAVDEAREEYEAQRGKGSSPPGVDFAALKATPIPVDLLSTSEFVAHFTPGKNPGDRGSIAFSSGFAELVGDQKDAIASIFAHEARRASDRKPTSSGCHGGG